MKRALSLCMIFGLALAVSACTASPEYPGVKTNVKIGRSQTFSTAYPAARNNTSEAASGLIRTQPSPSGDQEICVGAWCSCNTD